MTTKLGVSCIAALVALCPGLAGAEPEACAFDEPIAVRIVTYPSRAALAHRYRTLVSAGQRMKLMRREPLLHGFATLEGDVHTLHVLEADWERRDSNLAVLGHELLHAFCGAWHPRGW
jgi:hypothetical protein